nr:hypothetical protein [Lysobacter maris]
MSRVMPAAEPLAAAALGQLPLAGRSPLFERLRERTPALLRRAPAPSDPARWHRATVAGRAYRFAQPLTFTPYAAARPCSARCRFCSETLKPERDGRMAARLRPDADYFQILQRALRAVRGIPMSWSLSGLEASDDEAWLLRLLETLGDEERRGGVIHERVLYSNGAGLARGRGGELVSALRAFDLSWLELSRHHPREDRNQAIMRFRPGERVADADTFAATARALAAALPLKLVCLLQRGGVDNPDEVIDYLRWAASLGARSVIFREFSRLDAGYRNTVTRRYIDDARVSIERLLEACMTAPWWSSMRPLRLTEGYYFWNLVMQSESGLEVVFETSDYAAMHRCHRSGDVYKLVFHPDGHLCAGWEPDHDLIWTPADG